MPASRRPQKKVTASVLPGRKKQPTPARKKAAPASSQNRPTRHKGSDAWAAELAALAWGLAHPTRATILHFLLRRRPTLCGEIVDHLPLAQSTVSQHLKILRETGWVEAQEDGPRVHYSVAPQSLARLKKLTQRL